MRCDSRIRSSCAKPRRGFVLIMVLLLISLAAVILVGTARKSLLLARQAVEAQEKLQTRWGLISCRRTLLERAEDILADRSEDPIVPERSQIASMIILGKMEFSFVLADENAKANLNTFLREKQARRIPTVVLSSQHGSQAALPLRLIVEDAKLQSWGQVFDLSSSSVPVVLRTANITCWGNGKLNLRRASDEAVRHVCGIVLTPLEISRLLRLRQSEWQDEKQLLSQLGLKQKQHVALRRIVSDRSTTYSLWVEVRSEHHVWQTQMISEGFEFSW